MNETKRGVIILASIIILILMIPISMMFKNSTSAKIEIASVDELKKIYAEKKENIIYIGSATCSWCAKFAPVIDKVAKERKIEYYYFDIANLNDTDMAALTKLLDQDQIGTPFTFVSNNSKIVKELGGYVEEDKFEAFLDKSLITEPIKKPDTGVEDPIIAELKEIYAKPENSVIYLGSATCSWCSKFTPVMEKLSSDKAFKYTYVDLNEYDRDTYIRIIEIFGIDSQKFGTPHTMVVNANKVIDTQPGYAEEAVTKAFLEKNQIGK